MQANSAQRPVMDNGLMPVQEKLVPGRVSDQLEGWLTGDRPKTLGSLLDTSGEGSFAIVFVLLMAVPALPLPTGGVTHIFEVITMLLALELIAGAARSGFPGAGGAWR